MARLKMSAEQAKIVNSIFDSVYLKLLEENSSAESIMWEEEDN